MDEQVERLTNKAWAKQATLEPSQRLLIAISGIPGSGKTSFATRLTAQLNARASASTASPNGPTALAALVPLDGFHLTRAQLDAAPDPEWAHARRGAPSTFDKDAFVALVRELRAPLGPESQTLYAPEFDHAVKDPVADAVAVGPGVRVVVLEGNYLSLQDGDGWAEAAGMMDELWFVEVSEEVARERLVRRHLAAGIARDETAARERADQNDLPNGRVIVTCRLPIDEVIVSREDGEWMR